MRRRFALLLLWTFWIDAIPLAGTAGAAPRTPEAHAPPDERPRSAEEALALGYRLLADGQPGSIPPPRLSVPAAISEQSEVALRNLEGEPAGNQRGRFHAWRLARRPAGSTATLIGTGAEVKLAPDLPGVFEIELLVGDEHQKQARLARREIRVDPLLGLPVHVGQNWAEARTRLEGHCRRRPPDELSPLEFIQKLSKDEVFDCDLAVALSPKGQVRLKTVTGFDGKWVSSLLLVQSDETRSCHQLLDELIRRFRQEKVGLFRVLDLPNAWPIAKGRILFLHHGQQFGTIITSRCHPGSPASILIQFGWMTYGPEKACLVELDPSAVDPDGAFSRHLQRLYAEFPLPDAMPVTAKGKTRLEINDRNFLEAARAGFFPDDVRIRLDSSSLACTREDLGFQRDQPASAIPLIGSTLAMAAIRQKVKAGKPVDELPDEAFIQHHIESILLYFNRNKSKFTGPARKALEDYVRQEATPLAARQTWREALERSRAWREAQERSHASSLQ